MRKTKLTIESPEKSDLSAVPEAHEALWEAYRRDPARFAREVLGSQWWQAQEETAELVANHRRVAVKAANGVGKTYLAADLLLWFLFCFRPSVVLTTAPTWRQVESLLWEEVRRRFRKAKALAALNPGGVALEGDILKTKLTISEGHFAMGLSTDDPVRFQGFHAENLLVILDEACGVQEEIWDAVEGICVGENNRALAISNPLTPSGRFYKLFHSARWKTSTISALAHPNVIRADATRIPGAVTYEAVADRIVEWCEPTGERIGGDPPEGEELDERRKEEATSKVQAESSETRVIWEGEVYRPHPLFLVRVMGEFPTAAEDSLVSRDWIEAAVRRGKDLLSSPENDSDRCVVGVDVARFGSDETVIIVRKGGCVLSLQTMRGADTQEVAAKVRQVMKERNACAVGVDSIGVGGGVVDALIHANQEGVVSINASASPVRGCEGSLLFKNLRAQTFWRVRELLRKGRISLPDDSVLKEQLAALRYKYSLTGEIQIESKDDIRKRGLPSPDRADALALVFCPLLGALPEEERAQLQTPCISTYRQVPDFALGRVGKW